MATAGTKTHASAGTGTVATAGSGLGQARARAGAGAGLMTAGGKSRKEYPPLCNDSGSCEESAMEKMPAPSCPSCKLNDEGNGGEKKGTTCPLIQCLRREKGNISPHLSGQCKRKSDKEQPVPISWHDSREWETKGIPLSGNDGH